MRQEVLGLSTRRAARAITACLLYGALLLSARTVPAQEVFWGQAADYLRAGNYEAAYNEADKQFKQHPDDLVLLRIMGVALLEGGYHDQAIDVLRHAVEVDPSSVSCRYYLAQALAYGGFVREAVAELNHILRVAPDSEYATRARSALPQLETIVRVADALPKQRRWSVYVRCSGEHDDNVPARAENDPDPGEQESWRAVCSASVQARILDQFQPGTPLTWGIGYAFYGSWHEEEELSAYDVMSHTAKTSFRRETQWSRLALNIELGGRFTQVDLDGEPYSETAGGDLEMQFQWARWAVLCPRYTLSQNDFEDDTEYPEFFSRDGLEQTVGASQYFYLWNHALIMGLGYEYRLDDTDGSQLDLDSHDFNGSLTLTSRSGLRLYTSARFQDRDYVEFTPDPPRRLDDVWTYYASLSAPLFVDELRVEAHYTYTTNESNLEFSDYRRQVAGGALSLAF